MLFRSIDMIYNCHEMSPDEYLEYYKFFAGDPVIRKIKNNDGVTTEIIPNRWGSILELHALSELYKIPICVYYNIYNIQMTSQNNSTLISQIYKSRNVLVQLMKSQGYNTTDYEGFSINETNTMKTNNQLDMILEKTNSDSGNQDNSSDKPTENTTKIYIKYHLGKTLRPNNLQEMMDDLFILEEILTNKDTLLIVVKDDVSETLLNYVKHIWESERVFIIIQSLKRLQFNILEHVLVPPHRVLSEGEKIHIKNKYNIMNDNEFPELERFDPVAQAIGIRPGQVCEIIRPSKTAISAPYYRICI